MRQYEVKKDLDDYVLAVQHPSLCLDKINDAKEHRDINLAEAGAQHGRGMLTDQNDVVAP